MGLRRLENLETWAPGVPAVSCAGDLWGDGDLIYRIEVLGNTFREAGGDDGTLTGIFVGRGHEGAAGTLERDDLTGAFGAERRWLDLMPPRVSATLTVVPGVPGEGRPRRRGRTRCDQLGAYTPSQETSASRT